MDSVEHVLSFSYGKDSTACFGACEILGWKIDRVVTADLWATQTVPADHPLMVEYKAKADEIIKQRWGLSPVLFHADGHTVHDFDLRFRLEDEGLLKPGDTRFKWKQLYEDLQYSLF